jgi:hypothetical protein
MASKLSHNLTIRTLAADLNLRPSEDPVSEIIRYCHKQVKRFLAELPSCCSNPAELLELVANKLRTEFREIHSDDDLKNVRKEFIDKKEAGFVTLHKELDGQVLGITLKRLNAKPWDLSYVSVIDCRGENLRRAYFTKWHELVHLLVLTDQSRLVFRRTHIVEQRKSPEEALVDVVAGTLAFYADLVRPYANGEISFEAIEALRQKLCPSASQQSALLGITQVWPTPCILVDARLAYKAGEIDPYQGSFGFKKVSTPVLRAVHAKLNDSARSAGIKVIPNFRVPPKSVIYRVFHEGSTYGEAIEDLSLWCSSSGARWGAGPVRVKARRFGDSVQALIVPIRIKATKSVIQ